MKFSIRDILLLTGVIAAAALLAQTWNTNRQLLLEQAALQSAVQTQNDHLANLLLQSEGLPQRTDWLREVDAISNAALAAFPELSARYSIVEPVDELHVSTRRIPLLTDFQKATSNLGIRVYIPTSPDIYLCYGIFPDREQQPRLSGERDDWLGVSAYSVTGPYSERLLPGLHDLKISWAPQADYRVFRFELDSRPILETVYQLEGINGASHSTVATSSQTNLLVSRDMERNPLLHLSNHHAVESSTGTTESIRLWLSKSSHNFQPFPNVENAMAPTPARDIP